MKANPRKYYDVYCTSAHHTIVSVSFENETMNMSTLKCQRYDGTPFSKIDNLNLNCEWVMILKRNKLIMKNETQFRLWLSDQKVTVKRFHRLRAQKWKMHELKM